MSGPFARRTLRALALRTKIVYAHHVGPPAPHLADFGVPFGPEDLDAQLSDLGRHFEFASLAAVLEQNGTPSQLLAVTFDDGFDLVGTGAKDVLDAHGVKATVFVIPAFVGNRGLMWRNKLSAIRALRDPDTYVTEYNRVTAQVGAPPIRAASELMGAAMRWEMGPSAMPSITRPSGSTCGPAPCAAIATSRWRPCSYWRASACCASRRAGASGLSAPPRAGTPSFTRPST